MRLYYSSYLFALCLSISACSPSTEEIKTILNAHIAGLGEEGSTMVTNVEKTEKLVAFDITFRDPNTNEELQPLT